MKEYTAEELQAKFEQLPRELQEAISSTKIHDLIKHIGEEQGLMIDQIGELVDQVGLVMLGLTKGSGFVDNISSNLAITPEKARVIADRVNTDVFYSLRNHMRDKEEEISNSAQPSTETSVGEAGGFSVEKPEPETAVDVTTDDKKDILEGIENPTPSVAGAWKQTSPETNSEPLSDHLLEPGPDEHQVTIPTYSQPDPKPATPPLPTTPKPRSADAYREPIN